MIWAAVTTNPLYPLSWIDTFHCAELKEGRVSYPGDVGIVNSSLLTDSTRWENVYIKTLQLENVLLNSISSYRSRLISAEASVWCEFDWKEEGELALHELGLRVNGYYHSNGVRHVCLCGRSNKQIKICCFILYERNLKLRNPNLTEKWWKVKSHCWLIRPISMTSKVLATSFLLIIIIINKILLFHVENVF